MSRLRPVRGTRDLLPEDCRRHRRVAEATSNVAERYGYGEIATPIFEFTEVLTRTLGETSDVVRKEMYTFTDRGGDRITLRPENTAGVARAIISGGLFQHIPLKFYYVGPMFRYERPQKGRLRQFHQNGVELLGVAEPLADAEVIAVGAHILEELGLVEKTRLELNSLGDPVSRAGYRAALVDYLEPFRDRLSEDSRTRLQRNPLRILDSKDEEDQEILEGAPLIKGYLNAASADFFAAVCDGLDELGIRYTLNPRLVRGLDYYTHTAFEFITDALGAQGAVIAGGRYDGLVEALGGPPTPAVGWAGGIERLAMLLDATPPAPRPLAVIPVGAAALGPALRLARDLRHEGFAVELGYSGNLTRRMKRANKLNARAAILIGDEELAREAVTLRDLDTGAQAEVSLRQLSDRLAPYR